MCGEHVDQALAAGEALRPTAEPADGDGVQPV